jgi:hypothetical protein
MPDDLWSMDGPVVYADNPSLGVGKQFEYDIVLNAEPVKRCGFADDSRFCILWPHHDGLHLPASLVWREGIAITGMRKRQLNPSSDADNADA